jgi:hypothetical protein
MFWPFTSQLQKAKIDKVAWWGAPPLPQLCIKWFNGALSVANVVKSSPCGDRGIRIVP